MMKEWIDQKEPDTIKNNCDNSTNNGADNKT